MTDSIPNVQGSRATPLPRIQVGADRSGITSGRALPFPSEQHVFGATSDHFGDHGGSDPSCLAGPDGHQDRASCRTSILARRWRFRSPCCPDRPIADVPSSGEVYCWLPKAAVQSPHQRGCSKSQVGLRLNAVGSIEACSHIPCPAVMYIHT